MEIHLLSKQENFPCYIERDSKNVPKIGTNGLSWAKENDRDLIIFDTAGRLQIDEELIGEIKQLKKKIVPDEVILVADSALGQEAVNVAKHFHEAMISDKSKMNSNYEIFYDLSNSYLLENSYNWKGVLSEPSIQWHELLKRNRIIFVKIIQGVSGKFLNRGETF